MQFKDQLVDLLGHCCPVEGIEAFATHLEGEVVGYCEWRLGQAKQEVVDVVEADTANASAATKPAKAGK